MDLTSSLLTPRRSTRRITLGGVPIGDGAPVGRERGGGKAFGHLGLHKARADDVDIDPGAPGRFGEANGVGIES